MTAKRSRSRSSHSLSRCAASFFQKRLPGQVLASLVQRKLGPVFPQFQTGQGLGLLPGDALLIGHEPGTGGLELHRGLLHLLNHQADHLFRFLGLVEHGIDVGADDVLESGKYAHEFLHE